MKKLKIKKESIKPFIFGCISMLVVFGIIFGGNKIYKNYKHNNEIKKQKAQENSKKKTIDGITYTINSERENDKKCDALKDVWIYKYDYFITNDGIIYTQSDKKYSDTKQNCKIYNDSIKIKSIVGNNLVSNDNKKYIIDYDYHGETRDLKLTEIVESTYESRSVPKKLYDDDIKYAYLYNTDEKYGDNPSASKEYIVLKNDGKLYKMLFKGIYNSYDMYFDYKFESEELFKDLGDEKVKSFQINKDSTNGYIITDKNIYIQTPTNKECLEYQDIECNYDYIKNKYLNKYINSSLTIEINQDWYSVTTIDKRIDISLSKEEK